MFTHIQALKKKEKKKPESFQTEESPLTQSANKQPSPKPTFFSRRNLSLGLRSPLLFCSISSLWQLAGEPLAAAAALHPGAGREESSSARWRACAVLSRRAGSPGQPGWEAQRNNPHKCGFNWHNYFDKDVIFNFERALTEAQHLQQRPRCQGRMRSARAAAAPSCAGLGNKQLEALGFAAFVQGAESSGPVVTRLKAKGRSS